MFLSFLLSLVPCCLSSSQVGTLSKPAAAPNLQMDGFLALDLPGAAGEFAEMASRCALDFLVHFLVLGTLLRLILATCQFS